MPRLLFIQPALPSHLFFTLSAIGSRHARNRLACTLLVLPAIMAGFSVGEAFAAPVCDRSVPIDAQCEIALDALRPTQPAVGLLQVEEKVAKLRSKADPIKSAGKRIIPVVQAPDGAFYLTDGHHQASALARLGASKVKAQVIGRFDNVATFWPEMQARHWVYLFDKQGNPIAPDALPKRVIDLADDPYRALAGFAEDAGYFKKTDTYFMQFQWARYFGARMNWQQIDRNNLSGALQYAGRLACQPEAKDLPGYAGPCPAGQ